MTGTGDSERQEPVDPRFLLANERTLLAWLRTSLAFVAVGVALVALRHIGTHHDLPLVAAAASCAVGIVTAAWSYWHWRRLDVAIREGLPLPPPTLAPFLVAGIVVLAVIGLVAVVVTA